jgi:outer membrane lipopolysaccharide assembly protein LptE/RlpB
MLRLLTALLLDACGFSTARATTIPVPLRLDRLWISGALTSLRRISR